MEGKALEWITIRAESVSGKIIRFIAMGALIVNVLLALLTYQLMFFVIAIVFGALYFYLWMNQFIEYEFCFVMGELEIVKVFNHRRRKKKFNCTLDEIEYIIKGVKKENAGQSFSYYVRGEEEKVYTLVINKAGKRTSIIMEAEQEFINELQRLRKVR